MLCVVGQTPFYFFFKLLYKWLDIKLLVCCGPSAAGFSIFSEQRDVFSLTICHLVAAGTSSFSGFYRVKNKRNYGVDKNVFKVSLMDDVTMKPQERSGCPYWWRTGLFLGIGGGWLGETLNPQRVYQKLIHLFTSSRLFEQVDHLLPV